MKKLHRSQEKTEGEDKVGSEGEKTLEGQKSESWGKKKPKRGGGKK